MAGKRTSRTTAWYRMHAVTEADFQRSVIDFAKQVGWRMYHTRDSRGSEEGFPDLVLVRGKRVLFVELKAQGGRLSAEQENWLAALGGVTDPGVSLWRPSDWDAIVEELQ